MLVPPVEAPLCFEEVTEVVAPAAAEGVLVVLVLALSSAMNAEEEVGVDGTEPAVRPSGWEASLLVVPSAAVAPLPSTYAMPLLAVVVAELLSVVVAVLVYVTVGEGVRRLRLLLALARGLTSGAKVCAVPLVAAATALVSVKEAGE